MHLKYFSCTRTSALGVDLRRNILKKLGKITPAPIKTILQALRLNQLLEITNNKYDLELSFQRDWAEDFKQNRSKVLEYWRRYRYLDEITRICQITEDTRILDVGCGISSVLHYVKGKKFGIDPLADEYLKIYEYPEGINIKKGFGEEIPFTDEYFDIVFCSNVLDHVTDPKETLNEIYRVLKPNGHFVLTVEIFKERMKRDRTHPHSLTKRDVYSLLVDRFTIIFERESSWISLRRYYYGSITASNKELVIISER